MSAQPRAPSPESPHEHYDALSPEEMASEWLTRATQTGAGDDNEPDDTREVPRDPAVGISEGSYRSAYPEAAPPDDREENPEEALAF